MKTPRPRLAISFSGGRSSAVMTKLCLEKFGPTHDISVTFANTGQEHPATLDFVKACDENWGFPTVWIEALVNPERGKGIRHKVVDYDTASRNGEPFEAYIAKYGVPGPAWPQCTTKLKELPMYSYRKSLGWKKGTYDTAIGIRADEFDRMSKHAEKERFVYPLVKWGWAKERVNAFMASVPWDLKLPGDHYGNCVWCWKKSFRKLATVARHSPEWFDFPARMEREYGHVVAPAGPRRFFRGQRTTQDVLEMAKENFVEYQDAALQMSFDALWDHGAGCGESCEIGADE